MSGNINKLIAYNYFGGKFTWLDYLYDNFPEPGSFNHLLDLFGGSFVVSLNYKGNIIRTANEINGEITNFFRVLRDQESDLIKLLELTPISNLEFNICWEKTDDPVENARRFYVRVRQSFFSFGAQRKNKGWHMAKLQVNCKGGETVSRFVNGVEKLHHVAKELRKNYQIINDNWETAIDKIDNPKAFIYADPPYPKESRASFNDYRYEFSNNDHERLAVKLHSISGLAMISGYQCDLMNDLYHDWFFTKFPVKKNNIRSGEVQECIWTNYNPQSINRQTLFNS